MTLLSLIPLAHAQQVTMGPSSSAAAAEASAPIARPTWWGSVGYGLLLHKRGAAFEVYEATSASLVHSFTGQIQGGSAWVDGEPIATVERTLNGFTFAMGDGTRIRWAQTSAPTMPVTQPSDDPIVSFEVLWRTLDEQCAIFDLAGVDWDAAYRAYRPMVNAATTDAELFHVLSSMLALLGDGHTELIAEDLGLRFNAGPTPRSQWMAERVDDFVSVVSSKLDVLYGTALESLVYGFADGGRVGYVLVGGLDGFSSTDNAYENYAIFADHFDAVLAQLAATEALVIDLRLNGGGDDHVGLAVVERLIQAPVRVWSKQARIGSNRELARPDHRVVYPRGVQYADRPVFVLTSDLTASAAETLTLGLRSLPNVTQFGTPTYGIFSNALDRTLPNGWEISLSNERYAAVSGTDFEQRGIQPHVLVPSFVQDLDQGRDPALEAVLLEIDLRRHRGTLVLPWEE